MRDGVELNATLYLPKEKEASARQPVIFTLTPYISDTYHERGAYFASHGYGFALVDVRGRGNSAGDFVTFVNEGHDGYDLVEWLARQSFCDGQVAMWGGSYAGFDQWSTAKELPPHLSTIVPAAAVHPGVDAPHYSNIGQPYVVRWLTLTNGHTGQDNLFADEGYWRAKFLAAYRAHIPFKSLDSFIGTPFQISSASSSIPRVKFTQTPLLLRRLSSKTLTSLFLPLPVSMTVMSIGTLTSIATTWRTLLPRRVGNLF